MYKTNRGGERAAPYKIITIILSSVLALMTLCLAFAFNQKAANDLREKFPSASAGGPVLGGNGEELESGSVHKMPSGLTFRSAAALGDKEQYDSITLHATIKPETAENKAVDWGVSFVEPASEWATGKAAEDYVSVTPQADGSTTATVQCLQPFGEQIRVTVSSREYPDKKAGCILDFAQRITDITMRTNIGGDAPSSDWVNIKATDQYYRSSDTKTYYALEDVIIEYTDYTVEDNFIQEYVLTGSEAMLEKLKTGGLANASLIEKAGSWTTSFKESVLVNRWAFKGFVNTSNYYNLISNELNAALAIARQNLDIPTTVIQFNFTGAYSSASYEIGLLSSVEGLGFGVESIELDQTHVVV